MAYSITSNNAGMQPIATDSTVKNHALGTIITANDPTYGAGEFIYLQGIASTAVGDAVTYDASYLTARAVAGNALPRAVAFAMSACVASEYGWYQIGGIAIANKTKTVSFAAGIAVGISTTALISVSSSLKELQGALVAVVASATTTTNNGDKIKLMINRPHLQGRIT
jgi:hypothetical protein